MRLPVGRTKTEQRAEKTQEMGGDAAEKMSRRPVPPSPRLNHPKPCPRTMKLPRTLHCLGSSLPALYTLTF